MAEHHIHVHIHGQQPDNNEVALQALASAGKQAAAQAPQGWGSVGTDTGDQTQGTNTLADNALRVVLIGIMAGAFIGREKGELSKETSADLASQIADRIIERLGSTPQLATAAAHVATGYIYHGQGNYKLSTIANRACETVEGLPF